ncbi:MFS transporter [Neomicrococcus aestuarii]|uniref:MFS transporter n=1 Tax=Neomicrococcus aestuarii TaxID=556325 RepID=A0A1L2ZQD1_9MICC|nr:MFS transporter [Neomicrococcus aestuarii]APF41248.1 MFS transporter [Neomicrococcus aestuarii]
MAPRALRPFIHRDYRVLVTALIASVFGQGMWAVAMVYQVKALGGGPIELSVVATATSLGILLLVLAGGIAADRLSKRKIIIAVEFASLLVMGTVAALALTGNIAVWHLAIAGFIHGAGAAFFFPAYSALLPQMLPPEDLLAANGVEGVFRPVLQQAAGPAIAGMIVAATAPGVAIAGIVVCHVFAFIMLLQLSHKPEYDSHIAAYEVRPSVFADLKEGVHYTVKTPWLLWTLLFAVISVLSLMGPIEVLLPFVVTDQLFGDAAMFGFLLAAYGIGSAIGSLGTASMRLPRRYLTLMLSVWGFGTLPLIAVGFISEFWIMAALFLVLGVTGGIGQVIWGTLLQRRVPSHMMGRVSSLDFFVSLSLLPVSMALAGPLSQIIPISVIFIVAGVVSPVVAVIAWLAGRMYDDEISHPLDSQPPSEDDREDTAIGHGGIGITPGADGTAIAGAAELASSEDKSAGK